MALVANMERKRNAGTSSRIVSLRASIRAYGLQAQLSATRRNHEGDQIMKLSARNQLKGKIVDVVQGATTSHVRIDIGGGVIVTSSITNEAVADLALIKGDEAWAVIKASDVMIGK
jgi:molybdopterin-binding protein